MIKIDENYTDYRDDTDPKYPGGKAVNATASESTDGTPLLADWMNDINGALQAIFIEAFGDINKVSGKPDNVQESDVLKAIKKIIEKLLPVLASQGDLTDVDPNQGVGLVKTVNRRPTAQECEKNESWAASPNWVYNLLIGNAEPGVNDVIAGAIRKNIGGGIKRIDFINETGFVEWDNGFKIEAVSFPIDKGWGFEEWRVFYFPVAFQKPPIYVSSFIRASGSESGIGLGVNLRFRSLEPAKFSVVVYSADSGMYVKGCLLVMGV